MLNLVAGDWKGTGVALAWAALRAGQAALDAIEQGIRAVESNPDDCSVGLGGLPNLVGEVELDGAVMDGRTRAAGAVGNLRGYAHPVSIARAVMEKLPHVMLVGAGAARFADEIGAERAELLTEDSYRQWQAWLGKNGVDATNLGHMPLARAAWAAMDPQHAGGTTVYLAQDAAGNIAAATSTSGCAWKYPGRLGDTPVVGAGLYADNRYGAAACTGIGELAIRTSLARSTVLYMKMGMSVEEAVHEAMDDMTTLPDWRAGGLTLYAIDAAGGHCTVGAYKGDRDDSPRYHVAAGDQSQPVERDVTRLDV
ncbi:MAG: N(4)-(beta-N-acetylglucosaminyl)-L-asparaginase [Anaerolineae bacterium]